MMLISTMTAAVASADDGSDSGTITPEVLQGSTDKFGGGDWIVVHAGSTNFGVVYGTPTDRNRIYIFADYKRFIGGVDYYDAQGNLLRTKGVPMWTVFVQSLDRLIEFDDKDGDYRFDLRRWTGNESTPDEPEKGLTLHQGWTLGDLTQVTVDDILLVNFTLSISNVYYTWVWDDDLHMPVPALPSEGTVERVAFTFHIAVGVEDATARVPWFRVTIQGGDEKREVAREFLGWREFEGQKVNMSVKYDHEIIGWDSEHGNHELLLETHMKFGYAAPRELLYRYRWGEGPRAIEGERENGTEIGDDDHEMPEEPRTVERMNHHGSIVFDDDWDRIGRFRWVSDSIVDGHEEEVYFQVHGGGPLVFAHQHGVFVGMHLFGAFVYEAGASIYHDPGFDTATYEFSIAPSTNISPGMVLALQLFVALVAVVLAIALKLRRKGEK